MNLEYVIAMLAGLDCSYNVSSAFVTSCTYDKDKLCRHSVK